MVTQLPLGGQPWRVFRVPQNAQSFYGVIALLWHGSAKVGLQLSTDPQVIACIRREA